MKYYIIAGETSGDSACIKSDEDLSKLDTSAGIQSMGAAIRWKRREQQYFKALPQLGLYGFHEVVMNLRTILKNIETCKKILLAHKPDVS